MVDFSISESIEINKKENGQPQKVVKNGTPRSAAIKTENCTENRRVETTHLKTEINAKLLQTPTDVYETAVKLLRLQEGKSAAENNVIITVRKMSAKVIDL